MNHQREPSAFADAGNQFGDTFFRLYEERFERDFQRACRDVAQQGDGASGICLDAKALYRALFFPGETSGAGDTVRESFRMLAEATEEAEAVLKRTWMIMATNFIDYRLKRGGNPDDINVLQDMLEEYSALLNAVYLDMSRSVELELPEVDRNSPDYRQIVAGFSQYALPECPGELKDRLRIFTCFRGIPVDSPAEVVTVGEFDVTFRVSPTQTAICQRMGLALVESPLHAMAYRAYSTDVDAGAREVTFSYFIPHDQPVERRRHQRVKPERPVEAMIRKGGFEVTGMLVDVSAVSAAVYLRNVGLGPVEEGDEVELHVWLPRISSSGEFGMAIPGTLGMIHSGVDGDPAAHRLVVQMPADEKLFDQICRYIVSAQTRCLRETTGAETAD